MSYKLTRYINMKNILYLPLFHAIFAYVYNLNLELNSYWAIYYIFSDRRKKKLFSLLLLLLLFNNILLSGESFTWDHTKCVNFNIFSISLFLCIFIFHSIFFFFCLVCLLIFIDKFNGETIMRIRLIFASE